MALGRYSAFKQKLVRFTQEPPIGRLLAFEAGLMVMVRVAVAEMAMAFFRHAVAYHAIRCVTGAVFHLNGGVADAIFIQQVSLNSA